MNQILKIEVNWNQYQLRGNHPAQIFLDKLKNQIDKMILEGKIEKTMIENKSCQYVYYACGSCSGNQARVDAYCNSSGGSNPDYSWCEPC